jgi:hypothetical protein
MRQNSGTVTVVEKHVGKIIWKTIALSASTATEQKFKFQVCDFSGRSIRILRAL